MAQPSNHVFQQPMPPPQNVEKPTILQQQSVIQSNNQQLQQQLQSMHDNTEDQSRQKSREILTRRPSYRYLACYVLHIYCILN